MNAGPAVKESGYRQVGLHTFQMISPEGVPNLRPCVACHPGRTSYDSKARGDYDGNQRVEGVRQEVQGLLNLLEARLSSAIKALKLTGCQGKNGPSAGFKLNSDGKIVLTDALGQELGDCNRNGVLEEKETAAVFPKANTLYHQAAYNYLLIKNDKSVGLHNYPYTVALLQRTLYALGQGQDLPAWQSYQAKNKK
jgi:hypothetical protein